MNIIDLIMQQIQTDCCNTDKEADYLKDYYKNATKDQKEAINRTLIGICGWSFDSLLEMEQE